MEEHGPGPQKLVTKSGHKYFVVEPSKKILNISTWRKRGVASNPLFIIPGFFLHFSLEPSYGYLRFEGNGKIPLGR